MAVSKGNCYLCGVELGKTAMKNHFIKKHTQATGQECLLLKIEGAYAKDYWLYVDIPKTSTLSTLDKFLRGIWLECCGHMSAFFRGKNGYDKIGMRWKIGAFTDGDMLRHEYDFGDTTETLVTVLGTVYRKQQRGVRLLARNIPPQFACCKCGKTAAWINMEEIYESDNPFFCEPCIRAADEEFEVMALPVTNSPRMGVCGYCGELDTYAFIPPKEEGEL